MMDSQIIKIIQETLIKYFPSAIYMYNYIEELRYSLQFDYNMAPPFTMSNKLHNKYNNLMTKHHCNHMLYVNGCQLNRILSLKNITDTIPKPYQYRHNDTNCKHVFDEIFNTLEDYGCHTLVDKFQAFIKHNYHGISAYKYIYDFTYHVLCDISNKEIKQFMIGYYKDTVKQLLNYDSFMTHYMRELQTAMITEIKHKIQQYTENGDKLDHIDLYHIYSNGDEYDTCKTSMFIYRLSMLKIFRMSDIYKHVKNDYRISNYCWRTRSYKDDIYSIRNFLERANHTMHINGLKESDEIRNLLLTEKEKYVQYITDLLLNTFDYYNYYNNDHLVPYAPILYGFELKYSDESFNRVYKVNEIILHEDPSNVIDTVKMQPTDYYEDTFKNIGNRIRFYPNDIIVERLRFDDLSTCSYTNCVPDIMTNQATIVTKFSSIGNVYKKILKKKQLIQDVDRNRISCRKSSCKNLIDIINNYGKLYTRCSIAIRNWIIFAKENCKVYNAITNKIDRAMYKMIPKKLKKRIKEIHRRRQILMRLRIIIQEECTERFNNIYDMLTDRNLKAYHLYNQALLRHFDDHYTKINLLQSMHIYRSINLQMLTTYDHPICHSWNPIIVYIEILDTKHDKLINIRELTTVTYDIYGQLFMDLSQYVYKMIQFMGSFFGNRNSSVHYKYYDIIVSRIIHNVVRRYYSIEDEIQMTYLLFQRFKKKYIDRFNSYIPMDHNIESFMNLHALLSYYDVDDRILNKTIQTRKVDIN